MPNSRRSHPPSLKARVAVEAIRGQRTTAEIAQVYRVHPALVSTWKKQALDALPTIFQQPRDSRAQSGEAEKEELYMTSASTCRHPLPHPSWPAPASVQKTPFSHDRQQKSAQACCHIILVLCQRGVGTGTSQSTSGPSSCGERSARASSPPTFVPASLRPSRRRGQNIPWTRTFGLLGRRVRYVVCLKSTTSESFFGRKNERSVCSLQ
jgi:transposase